jgi:hypothetical protein
MNPLDDDPLLRLIGSGRDIWADEHADEYVRRLRESWDERTAWEIVEDEERNRVGGAEGTKAPEPEGGGVPLPES